MSRPLSTSSAFLCLYSPPASALGVEWSPQGLLSQSAFCLHRLIFRRSMGQYTKLYLRLDPRRAEAPQVSPPAEKREIGVELTLRLPG